jgi:hypothetical protein
MNEKFDLTVFPKDYQKALLAILSEQGIVVDLEAGDSLVYGVVRRNGAPDYGATVETDNGDPLYFGSLELPDNSRRSTSENGLFIYVVKNVGWNVIKIKERNGKDFSLNVLSFPGKITQVFADVPSADSLVTVRTFDAFSGDPVESKIEFQQLEEIAETNHLGIEVIDVPRTMGLSIVERFAAEGYRDARHFYSYLTDYLHLPAIKETWLANIANSSRVNFLPERTTVIGFVQEEDFELISPFESIDEVIIYFDQSGTVVDKVWLGVALLFLTSR